MAAIILRLADFRSSPNKRPKNCPYCGSDDLQGWGAGEKQIQDAQSQSGEYRRYQCNSCQRTFRHYAEGVDRTRITQRIRRIAGLAWLLGISSREVAALFGEVGIEINYMTVWREGKSMMSELNERFGPEYCQRYTIDKEFLKIRSRGIGTSLLIEIGPGKSLVLGRMAEVDYRKVLDWLDPILAGLDIVVSLTSTDRLFE